MVLRAGPFVAALVLILILGSLRLFDPFSGDQALFLVAAQKLHAGGVLYRDFWDVKQPGIFAFFLAGGLLFGFDQTGLHAADLVWELIFSGCLFAALGKSLHDARWAALAPVAVVGAYFSGSSPWHLLQVEGLAGLPLFCVAWSAIESFERPSRSREYALLSGVAAGIVVLFKLLFAPIVLAIVGAAAIATRRSGTVRIDRFFAIWAAGVALPLGLFAVYTLHYRLTKEVADTFFALPVAIDATPLSHAPPSRLYDSAARFVLYFRGLIFLALVAIISVRSEPARRWRIVSVSWLCAGLAVILVQRESWWQYHFLLELPPLGILATFGAGDLARRVRTAGVKGLLALGISGIAVYIAVPLPQAAIATALEVVRERPYATRDSLEKYRCNLSAEYAAAKRDAAFVEVKRAGPSIYVLGDPLIYLMSNKLQAIAINGWALQLYTPEVWDRLNGQLRVASPRYLFALNGYETTILPARSPQTATTIATRYVLAHVTPDGSWYRRRATLDVARHARQTPRRRRSR